MKTKSSLRDYNTYSMFAALAKLAIRFKLPIVILWIAVAAALTIFSPSLSRVGVTDDTQFLPRDTESNQAAALLEDKFSGAVDSAAGTAQIIIFNSQGLNAADTQTARDLRDWLASSNAPAVISKVVSVFDNQALRSTLISQDQKAMLISLGLSKGSSNPVSREAVFTIRDHIRGLHSSSEIYVTGPAGVFSDVLSSIEDTINKATLVTIILVIVLLLLIYRSPVAMLVPLITIGVSYLVARGITGFIAASSGSVSSLVDAYLVVTLFGIGTDYCLFMVSRFKEEILGNNRQSALELAVKRIGPVILASACTVIVALLCLGISHFGMNRTSGYILAIGVAITLLAGLTLTPSLISIFGSKLLWPARLQGNSRRSGSFWTRIGERITQRPLWFLLPIVVLLALPYTALPKINFTANLISQMPPDINSVKGYDILKSHFPTGELNPLHVVIESANGSLTSSASLNAVSDIAGSLKNVNGVSRVRYFSAPAGQLTRFSQQSQSLSGNLGPSTLGQLSFFSTLGNYLQDLAVEYPGVAQSLNFQQAAAELTQVSSLAAQIQPAAPQNIPGLLSQIKPLADDISVKLQALASEFNLNSSTPLTKWLQSAYFSTDGKLTRIDVLLSSDPYAKESIDAVGKVRETAGKAIEASPLKGAVSYVGGISAGQEDILAVNGADFLRVLGLAILGILIVTIILLRSLFAPLYMILTVLFNFGATLGIATWIFIDILKQDAMIYMLPIFVFVILIAVGSDYNIFLVSRIREESHRNSHKDAICNAVTNTGGVITSCGIILAGTFGSLTTASLTMVFQVGAAIGIGVLIDTFLVRAMLIPSIATLAGRLNWWPSRLFKKNDTPWKGPKNY